MGDGATGDGAQERAHHRGNVAAMVGVCCVSAAVAGAGLAIVLLKVIDVLHVFD